MTYIEHLKNELRSFLKRPILLIFISLLMFYHYELSQILTFTFWIQFIGGFAVVFPIFQYLNYKYLQKNKYPFKERLSAAIRIHRRKVIAALIPASAKATADKHPHSKILIAQRGKKDLNYGKWEFPGGKLEDGETEQECLARELNEELGIDATIGDYFCSSFFEHKGTSWEMRAYFVSSFTGDIELREHQEVRWVKIKDLPIYDMPDPDKPIVEKLLKSLNKKLY